MASVDRRAFRQPLRWLIVIFVALGAPSFVQNGGVAERWDKATLTLGALMLVYPAGTAARDVDSAMAVGFIAINTVVVALVAFAVLVVQQVVVAWTVRALGDEVRFIQVGYGPALYHRQGTPWSWTFNLAPVFGHAAIMPSRMEGDRFRIGLARLAGIAIIAVPLILLVWSHEGPFHALFARRLAPDAAFGVAASIITLNDLFRIRINDQELHQLRKLATLSVIERQTNAGAYELAVATARKATQQFPGDMDFAVTLANVLSTRGTGEEAFETLRTLLEQELPPSHRAHVLNSWAWLCYRKGDETLKDEADRASREALEVFDHAAVRDTRGHVLLWLKRYAEAEPLLLSAYHSEGRNCFGKMYSASALVMVYAAMERDTEAREWLARARAEGIEDDVLARAAAAVEPLSRR